MQLRDLFDDLSASPTSAQGATSDPVHALLEEPLDVFKDWQRAEQLLLTARAKLPERLEISAALYKMYAYANRHHEALMLIDDVLMQAAERTGWPHDYRLLDIRLAQWEPVDGPIRHYLYALKAKAFVLLRKRSIDAAWSVLEKLKIIDPLDQVGGSVVSQMAERVREQLEQPN